MEQKYAFVDLSGCCFDAFAKIKDNTDYHKLVSIMLKKKKHIVGDMLCFRDDLQSAGFKWGIDFCVRKV